MMASITRTRQPSSCGGTRNYRAGLTVFAVSAIALALLAIAIRFDSAIDQAGEDDQVGERGELWLTEFKSTDEMLHSLKSPVPNGLPERAWLAAVDRLQAGFWNACHSERHLSILQMRRLRQKIQETIDRNGRSTHCLSELWDTIGQASEAASRHCKKFRSDFMEYIERLESGEEPQGHP